MNKTAKIIRLDDRRPKTGKVLLGVALHFDGDGWLTTEIELDPANCSEPDFLIAVLGELNPEGRAKLTRIQVCNLSFATVPDAVPWLDETDGKYHFNRDLTQRALRQFQENLRLASNQTMRSDKISVLNSVDGGFS